MRTEISSITTVINLSLESYFNAGLSPERCAELIGGIKNPTSFNGRYFVVGQTGINYNPSITLYNINNNAIEDCIYTIDVVLSLELRKIKGKRDGKVKS
jgi:hypothetical protein